MSNVFDFKTKTKIDTSGAPHVTGPALCIGCGHQWQAVAPTGTLNLECPQCKTMRALFNCVMVPAENVWTCSCMNQTFYITEAGAMCLRCGHAQTKLRIHPVGE